MLQTEQGIFHLKWKYMYYVKKNLRFITSSGMVLIQIRHWWANSVEIELLVRFHQSAINFIYTLYPTIPTVQEGLDYFGMEVPEVS